MDNLFKKNTYIKIFWIFIIGSIIGTLYEEIINLFKTGNFEVRSSVIYGPFNIEYGIGLALFAIFLGKNNNKRKWYLTYIYCVFIGGFTEYISSLLIEKIYNMRFWNYCDKFLNINGRTTIIYSLFWGLIGFIFMKFIYPKYEILMNKLKNKLVHKITIILTIFMIINFIITAKALKRYDLRMQNIFPKNEIEILYDVKYNNELINKKFSNMEYLK